jgi:hypothetical protein
MESKKMNDTQVKSTISTPVVNDNQTLAAKAESKPIAKAESSLSTDVLKKIDAILSTHGLKLLVQVIPIKGNRGKCVNIQIKDGIATMVTSACSTATPEDLGKELASCTKVLTELKTKGVPVSLR